MQEGCLCWWWFLTFDVDSGQDVLEGCSMKQIADFLLRLQRQRGRGRENSFHLKLEGFHSGNLDPGSAGSRAPALGVPFIGSVTLLTSWRLRVYLSSKRG